MFKSKRIDNNVSENNNKEVKNKNKYVYFKVKCNFGIYFDTLNIFCDPVNVNKYLKISKEVLDFMENHEKYNAFSKFVERVDDKVDDEDLIETIDNLISRG